MGCGIATFTCFFVDYIDYHVVFVRLLVLLAIIDILTRASDMAVLLEWILLFIFLIGNGDHGCI